MLHIGGGKKGKRGWEKLNSNWENGFVKKIGCSLFSL